MALRSPNLLRFAFRTRAGAGHVDPRWRTLSTRMRPWLCSVCPLPLRGAATSPVPEQGGASVCGLCCSVSPRHLSFNLVLLTNAGTGSNPKACPTLECSSASCSICRHSSPPCDCHLQGCLGTKGTGHVPQAVRCNNQTSSQCQEACSVPRIPRPGGCDTQMLSSMSLPPNTPDADPKPQPATPCCPCCTLHQGIHQRQPLAEGQTSQDRIAGRSPVTEGAGGDSDGQTPSKPTSPLP